MQKQNKPMHANTHINPSPAYAMALSEAVRINNEGLALMGSGQYDAAEKKHLKALDLKLRYIGENTITTALSHNALGELYIAMCRLDDAEKHLKLAIKIRNAEGPTFDAAGSRENLAIVHEMRGNLLEAKKMRKSTGKFACGNCDCPGQVFNKSELKQCSECTAIFYCTPACQKADWKRHKKYCHKSELSKLAA